MWGGRFAEGPSAVMRDINVSIGVDKRLWRQDIAGSRAHAAMLAAAGILSAEDAAAIAQGLDAIEAEYAAGGLVENAALEDIHMHVEARLKEIIGEPAGRLHTARSRNDQVATDFRLWVRGAIDAVDAGLAGFQTALLARAEQHAADVMPGFTHLQTAQPVTLGHHLMAYHEMARRDRGRFADARRRMNESPLGAAALAGTSFPVDRHATAQALGFDRPMANSLDAVSDRDFALEFLSAAAMAGLHLSRLAEEIIVWASQPYGFVKLPDAFSTGSSIMPQKRNPDVFELVRGRTATAQACLTEVLGITAKLPSGYQRDLQLIKAPLFRSIDLCGDSLAIMAAAIPQLRFRPERIRMDADIHAAAEANALVAKEGIPFREAYRRVGQKLRED